MNIPTLFIENGYKPLIDNEMYHWEYGIHDGTPSCCIQEFVDDRRKDPSYLSFQERGSKVHIDKDWFSVYIPCTKCHK